MSTTYSRGGNGSGSVNSLGKFGLQGGAGQTRAASVAWGAAAADARASAAWRNPLLLLAGIICLIDGLAVLLPPIVVPIFKSQSAGGTLLNVSFSAFACFLAINLLWFCGAYGRSLADRLTDQVRRAWLALILTMAAISGLIFIIGAPADRLALMAWLLIDFVALFAIRLGVVAAVAALRARGRLSTTAAVIDLVEQTGDFAQRLTRGAPELYLAGVFFADHTAAPGRSISDLIKLATLFRIDDVFVRVGMGTAQSTLSNVLQHLNILHTRVHVCPDLPHLAATPIHRAGVVRGTVALTAQKLPIETWGIVAKRVEDLVLGSIALILVAPVMLLVAIAIKFDSPGPIFFRQARQGFNNNAIVVFKFRTMKHNTGGGPGTGGVVQAKRADPRVTRLGRFLRRSSIDELPQLFNVLKGEMSLVGPRPHAIAHNEQYSALIAEYLGRHRVQPGITGWAQANGFRGETDTLEKMRSRVEYDLHYIENWSILFDLKIILLTAWSIMIGRNAY